MIERKIKLYHISFNPDLPREIDPDKHEFDGVDPETSAYPEQLSGRFCCSPTIIQCFQAIYPNVKHFFDKLHYPHMDFYVYMPNLTPDVKVVTPETLTKERSVHDAHVTQEYDIVSPVKIRKVALIRIKRINPVGKKYYQPFDDSKEPEGSWVPKGFSFTVIRSGRT